MMDRLHKWNGKSDPTEDFGNPGTFSPGTIVTTKQSHVIGQANSLQGPPDAPPWFTVGDWGATMRTEFGSVTALSEAVKAAGTIDANADAAVSRDSTIMVMAFEPFVAPQSGPGLVIGDPGSFIGEGAVGAPSTLELVPWAKFQQAVPWKRGPP